MVDGVEGRAWKGALRFRAGQGLLNLVPEACVCGQTFVNGHGMSMRSNRKTWDVGASPQGRKGVSDRTSPSTTPAHEQAVLGAWDTPATGEINASVR